MRTQTDRVSDLNVGRLIETYDEYIKLLTESEADLIGLAYVHGYRCPDALVKRGEELRARINELKGAVLGSK